jgi:hypothetical protein
VVVRTINIMHEKGVRRFFCPSFNIIRQKTSKRPLKDLRYGNPAGRAQKLTGNQMKGQCQSRTAFALTTVLPPSAATHSHVIQFTP